MLKNATYKEKFSILREWIPTIVESIKKDLKNEHLKKDLSFTKKYLAGKNIAKLTTDDLIQAYSQALEDSENSEALAEFMANRWLLKNTELYEFFEAQLRQISQNFTELDEIDSQKSKEIVAGSIQAHGALPTYLFAVINSVVFPKQIYTDLGELAREHHKKSVEEARIQQESFTVESTKKHYEQLMNRLTDKYEKKLSGLQKKYVQDMESLKKQVGNLQRKLDNRT